ncbi:Proteophosphoglycan 5 [Rhodotorula toruloides ATCC 204091]|uniref:Proteophosphoglycan 5 n=1 Tax=Rhodotorula toruloides TaxID=5286 RepID=A0A2T0AAR9_RHOTO|nr:Proteophosphoglycan 5 [Rhodotorula toruloides ATCC 204091]PRQ75092.1 Proteophosphoglycan 5 [Rhodotorula toruloides]
MPGLLYVELAAAGGTDEATRHDSGGVVIRADQSYEAALREVQSSFSLSETTHDCCFAQRLPHRDKPFIVAPSAWELLPAGSHLEFVVTPRGQVKPVVDVPAVIKLEDPSSSAEGAAVREASLPPSTVRSQAASSQATSFHAPATPSNTDDSDVEVSDSEDESIALRGGVFGPRPSRFAGEGEHGDDGVEAENSRHDAAQRARSASPSPSTLSTRNGRIKADLRRRIEESEGEERFAGSSSNPHNSSGFARTGTPDGTPRASRTSADSEAPFRVGLDANGNVAFVAPSPAPWSPASRPAAAGPSRKGKERAHEPAAASPAKKAVKKEASSPAQVPVASTSGSADTTLRRTTSLHPDTVGDASASSYGLSSSRSFPNLSFGSASSSISPALSSIRLRTTPRAGRAAPASPARPHLHQPSPYVAQATPPPPPASQRSSTARKSWSDKRREALSRPRVSIPPPGRSERFHYWIRLPNWPTAPRNMGPLRPNLLFKQQARGDVTLGLTLARVFDAAAEHSGWEVKDLKAIFHVPDDAGKEEDVVVWGWDTILTEFCDLEEIGLEGKGDVVDFDYVPYSASRGCYDLD